MKGAIERAVAMRIRPPREWRHLSEPDLEVVYEAAHRPDPVLGQIEVVVIVGTWQVAASEKEELVRRVHPARSPLRERALPGLLHLSEGRLRVRGDKQPDRAIQVVAGESDRNHRKREDSLAERPEIVQRAVEVRAVVPPRAEHDLGMDLESPAQEVAEVVHDEASGVADQQPLAHHGLCGVDAHVQG